MSNVNSAAMSMAKISRGKVNFRVSLLAGLLSLGFISGAWAGPVDINHADAATIAKELNGIGPAHAKAIVQYREKNGGFKSADDLRKVKGIGPKVIERNRANIRTAALSDTAKKS